MIFESRLGVALTGHHLDWKESIRLGRLAERAGFDLAIVDGDETRIPRRPHAELYDGAALRGALLQRTRRIRVASIELPGFRSVTTTARCLATQQLISGGRVLCFLGVGSGRHVRDLGLPSWTTQSSERLRALEESLWLLRQLWQGQPVRWDGPFERLHEVTSPRPEPSIPICVAAARPKAVALAAQQADIWDANVPPLSRFLDPLRARLGRLPDTWIWVFGRPDLTLDETVDAYRRHCPWFPPLTRSEYQSALLYGAPNSWPQRIETLRSTLDLACIILDLIGLAPSDVERALAPWRGDDEPD